MEPLTYLWKDRKRILGMPISFTKYALTEDRIFMETGLLNLCSEEVILYRVRDMTLKISLGQRIFRVGSVVLASSDKTTPVLELKNIRQPRGQGADPPPSRRDEAQPADAGRRDT